MDLNYYMPVTLITGEICVKKNADKLAVLGKKAMLVTGKNSARESGALQDVTDALTARGIGYVLFDEVEQNPLLSVCKRGGDLARESGVDFLIGIGGGSPLDATKAIAVFAANELEAMDVFSGSWAHPVLPFALVGTTAGTGSEVTPYSILTVDATGRKKTVSHPSCFARIAFGDARYTLSLPRRFTVSTALDALSHAIEGYFASSANTLSDLYALKAAELLVKTLSAIFATQKSVQSKIPLQQREALYEASILAGLVITRTGTGYCHPMGYFLSEEYGVPHGIACALYLPSYIRRGKTHLPDKAAILAAHVGMPLEDVCALIERLHGFTTPELSESLLADLLARWENLSNFQKSPGGFSTADARKLMTELYQK